MIKDIEASKVRRSALREIEDLKVDIVDTMRDYNDKIVEASPDPHELLQAERNKLVLALEKFDKEVKVSKFRDYRGCIVDTKGTRGMLRGVVSNQYFAVNHRGTFRWEVSIFVPGEIRPVRRALNKIVRVHASAASLIKTERDNVIRGKKSELSKKKAKYNKKYKR